MVTVHIDSKWHLKDDEYQAVVNNGNPNKTTWWFKNITTGQFVSYAHSFEERIPGNKAFVVTMDLEPGEYMGGTGDYNLISDEGRHCSQIFYYLVTEEGGAVCKKNELPSNGGSGPANAPMKSSQTSFGGTTSSWGGSTVKSAEYCLFPGFVACINDMSAHSASDCCDSCDMINFESGNICCANCVHKADLFIKEQQ